MSLVKWEEIGRRLIAELRLRTDPVGVKLYAEDEKLPEELMRPSVKLGHPIAPCQAIGMARRYGWTIALKWKDDVDCLLAAYVYNMTEAPDHISSGRYSAGLYFRGEEEARRFVQSLPRLNYRCTAAVFSSLRRPKIEPQAIIAYTTPAQAAKMIAGTLWGRGGRLHVSVGSGVEIDSKIVEAINMEEVQLAIPCGGDRIFGGTEEDEVAVVIPASIIDDVMEGLENTRKIFPYPIAKHLRYTFDVPRYYRVRLRDLE